MKKFFEKHDLFKLTGIMMLVAALLTWILTYSVYNGSELVWFNDGTVKPFSIFDTSTIGIFDFNTYGLLSLYYFTNVFVFIFVVFGFYKVIGSTESYKAIVEKIANVFKGKELIYIIVNVVFYAIFASVATSKFILFAFIPFSLSVLNRLKVDKIGALMTTFGASIIGVIAATYSEDVVGSLINYGGFAIKYGYEFASIVVMAVILVALLVVFIALRMKNAKKLEVVPDLFSEATAVAEEKKTKKKTVKRTRIVPMSIILVVFFVILILGFVSWTALNVDVFTNLHKSITEATIGGKDLIYPILVLGSTTLGALGTWDLFTAGSFMIITMVIVKFVEGIKLDSVIDNIGEGIKLSVKPVALLMMIYTVLVFSVSYPVIPGVVNAIMTTLTAKVLRPVAWVLSGFVTSVFTVDMQYTTSVIGSLFASFNSNAAALALQASYGIAGFIAPTSAILMLGLSMLDIKFKDYFKFIWKFLLALVVVVLAVLYILLYV